jgi:hypothetical protein
VRFVITGEWNKNRLLRVILLWFLLYAALFWVTSFILYFDKMGLSPSSVVAYYLGDEAQFTQPRSLRGLTETSHFHLFAMGTLVLTLTHLVLFVPIRPGVKGWLVVASFATALADESAGWLVRFCHPGFAVVKVGAFLSAQAALGALLIVLGVGMVRGHRNAYADNERT